ncbi:MAG TPA: class I SAM-dependent methyltransferase [Acidobacteriota bacterium]
MKRTIEKLHRERVEKEQYYFKGLDRIESHCGQGLEPKLASRLENRLSRLEEKISRLAKEKKAGDQTAGQQEVNSEVLDALREMKASQAGISQFLQSLSASLLEALRLAPDLMDAKDREWDALGNNHVGMIFKSMEWRVDRLTAEYEDVKLLMRSFLALEDGLTRLRSLLQEKKLPTPREVDEILEPLRDWRYAGFENRFRGSEADVRRQQEGYLALYRAGGSVLDLGCGRGEFLELLRDRGFKPKGVDLNSLAVGQCLDKGLNCRQGDLLAELAGQPDQSLDGIFSSQVVEHLQPEAIRRLVELAFQKLRPGGALVLETINPLSVFALVHIYFLDMSHRTPVHPLALRFLLETTGFEAVELRYPPPPEGEQLRPLPPADETAAILNRNIDSLNALLFAAPNYAATGKKP